MYRGGFSYILLINLFYQLQYNFLPRRVLQHIQQIEEGLYIACFEQQI
jgi:hypothetical protein